MAKPSTVSSVLPLLSPDIQVRRKRRRKKSSKMRKRKTKKRRKKRRRKSRKKRRRKHTNRGGALPAGWNEHWDSRRRRPYYFHAATGRSVWEQWEIMDVDEGSATPEGVRGRPDRARRHGATSYVNAHTGERIWIETAAANPFLISSAPARPTGNAPLLDGLPRTSPPVWGSGYVGDQHTPRGADYVQRPASVVGGGGVPSNPFGAQPGAAAAAAAAAADAHINEIG